MAVIEPPQSNKFMNPNNSRNIHCEIITLPSLLAPCTKSTMSRSININFTFFRFDNSNMIKIIFFTNKSDFTLCTFSLLTLLD